MLIKLYDLKSRPTKVINIENNICFDFSDIIYMELSFPCLLFFGLNNEHGRLKSMGNRYTNLVWDHCHWVWHNMFAAKYQSYKLKRIYLSNVNCNWTCEVDMLELRLVCLLGTIVIVMGAFGPPAVSVVNAYEISHKLVNLRYKN